MSKFRIEVSGFNIVEAESTDEIRTRGLFLQEVLNSVADGKYRVSAYDYDNGRNVSLAPKKNIVAYTGRQESEGVIQAMIRSLTKAGLLNDEVSENTASITENSLKLDEATNHYSPDYGKLHDNLEPFAVDQDRFAVEFKSVLSDILLNNAAGGTAFMKKAKKG